MAFVKFMTSTTGRAARVIVGLIILSVGLLGVQGAIGTVLAVVALVPIAGGLLDFCVAGVMLGYPFKGADARKQLAGK